MKSFEKFFCLFVIVLGVFLTLSTNCYADHSGHKLVRGVGNVLTGWLEIPMNIYETSVDENPFVGITIGLAKGIGMTIARTCVGAYETITFPFPIPEGYDAIIDPEYVFQKEV